MRHAFVNPSSDADERHHLLIAGTGRAGTTALVELLDALGLETHKEALEYYEGAHAGYEAELTDPRAPYVVKAPRIDLAAVIADGFDPSRIDRVIVPIRELDQALLSRKAQSKRSDVLQPPGGLGGRLPWRQETMLLREVYELIHAVGLHAIPITFLAYPRYALDWQYAHQALRSVVPVDPETFRNAWTRAIDPDKVRARPLERSVLGDLVITSKWLRARGSERLMAVRRRVAAVRHHS